MAYMEFAKYYNVTKIVTEMINNKEIKNYPTGNDSFSGIYVCMDTNDFWICRINKDLNEEYKTDIGKFLIERNKISIYDIMNILMLTHNTASNINITQLNSNSSVYKNIVHNYFNQFSIDIILKAVIIYDDKKELENWDFTETDSIEEAISILDSGFGIIEI